MLASFLLVVFVLAVVTDNWIFNLERAVIPPLTHTVLLTVPLVLPLILPPETLLVLASNVEMEF